ncbi:hypothetical protein AHF37_04555 [Paragonimus kellicotti]|nr:hypothetical protein AHF37_04555 [Paragonimus kellicotti]
MMGVGGITLITALFGCCGAYHESQCLLGAYFTILLFIFTAQVTGVTLGYVFREELQCCGVNGYTDYRVSIPVACCNRQISNCDELRLSPADVYTESDVLLYCPVDFLTFKSGLRREIRESLRGIMRFLLIVMVCIAAFEIFCLLFAIVMCCAIRQYHSDYYGVDYAIAT